MFRENNLFFFYLYSQSLCKLKMSLFLKNKSISKSIMKQ